MIDSPTAGSLLDHVATLSTWPESPYVRHDAGQDLLGFASWDCLSELVSIGSLRIPDFRLVREGQQIPDAYITAASDGSFGVGGRINSRAVAKSFAAGWTIVLQGVQRYSKDLSAYAHEFSLALGHPVFLNAYLTPAQSSGFPAHADPYHAWLVQTEGRKEWRLWSPNQRPDIDPPDAQLVLERSDSLWIPKGWHHAGVAREEPSAHLTVTVRAWRVGDLVAAISDLATESLDADAVLLPRQLSTAQGILDAATNAAGLVDSVVANASTELISSFGRIIRERRTTADLVNLRSIAEGGQV